MSRFVEAMSDPEFVTSFAMNVLIVIAAIFIVQSF